MLTLFKKLLSACIAAAACMVGGSSYGWEIKEWSGQGDYGTWSPRVSYDGDGWASIANATYTGNIPSDGNIVTLKTVMRFCGEGSDAAADAQAAVRMALVEDRPMFQVRSGGEWILAGAEGVVPYFHAKYEVAFTIDYAAGRYSVKVGDNALTAYESGASSFVLNGAPTMLRSVLYGGTTAFKSLNGSQSDDNRTAWLGSISEDWADAGNWAGNNRNEPYFLENAMRGNRRVVFNSAQTIAGVVHVDAGTASRPLVFSAADADCGLSNGGKEFRIGENGDAVVCFENGKWTFEKMYVAMGNGTTAAVTNLNADLALSELNIAAGECSAGTFTQEGGMLTAANGITFCTGSTYADAKGPSTFALNGGVVAVKYVRHGPGAAVGEFRLNGGTLKAAAKGTLVQNHGLLNVIVDEGGGTIDNGGFNVTLAKSMEGTGSLELAGSGVTTFTTNQLYTGGTKIAGGTGIKSGTANAWFAGTLVFTNGSRVVVSKNGSGCNSLSAADVTLPSDGTVTVSVEGALPATACPILTKTEGSFRATDLVKFTAAATTFQLALSLDRKSICIVPGGASFVWTGTYDTNLLDGRNWSSGVVPSASGASTEINAVIGVPEATNLVCNGEFSPTSIVFPQDSAQVTISGSGRVTNVCEIANLASGVNHVFAVPVFIADGQEADVTLVKTDADNRYVRFLGGLTAWDVKKGCGTEYHGLFNFLRPNIDWSEKDAVRVQEGSITLNGALNSYNFSIYTYKSVNVNGDMPVSGETATTKQLVWRVYGRLAVSNLITLSGVASLKPAASYGNGAYAAKGLYNGSTGKFYLNTTHEDFSAHWEIGESGLAASGNSGGFHVCANSPATLNSLAGYAISAPIDSDANARLKIGTGNVQDRTITVDGELKGGMSVELSGLGTVALNSVSTFTGGLVATNGVTLALGPNAKPGSGVVSMEGGTRLCACGNEIGGLSFAAGSTLDVLNPTDAAPAVSVAGGLTLPSGNESVTLCNNGGAFGAGTYAILGNAGVEVAAGAKLAPVVGDGMEYRFLVDDGVLKLVVYSPDDRYRWTGWGEDNNMSTHENWMCGCRPGAGARLVFDREMTVNADIGDGVTLSGLDLRAAVTFNGSLRTTTDVATSNIVVGANSTVTLVGDLVFSGNGRAYVANKINYGGRLVVTGKIEARGTREVYPTVNGGSGYIVANGLVNQSGMNDIAPFKLVRNTAGTVRWVIGSDGMDGRSDKTFWLLNNENHPVAEIMPIANDFVIGSRIASRKKATLKLNTTGLDDNLGHTITVTNGIYREGPVQVNGTGKVLCRYVQANSTNPFSVNGTATLELADGADIGRGGVTVNTGARLEVSGVGATVGALTMERGATISLGSANGNSAQLMVDGEFSVAGASGAKVSVRIGSGTVGAGTYTVLSASSISANAGDFELANVASGCTATFSTSGNALVVTVAGETPRGMALANPKSAILAEGLGRASLLCLDPARADASGEVTIKGIRVHGKKVEVDVALERRGALQKDGADAPINGVVRLYAVDLATGRQTLVGGAAAGDPTFAKGDTTTFAFETEVPAGFYRAVIEEAISPCRE